MARLIGYLRVSTSEQGDTGLGLDAQKAAIRVYAAQVGHELIEIVSEVESAAKTRPVFETAMMRVEAGEFDGIIAAKLDRFSRSVVQTDEILTRLGRADRILIALDLGVDTGTAAGRLIANVLAAVAQWERDVISERTRAALGAKKRRGGSLGAKRRIDDSARLLVQRMRGEGATFRQMCEALEREGHKTARGGPWRASTVQRLLQQSAPANGNAPTEAGASPSDLPA